MKVFLKIFNTNIATILVLIISFLLTATFVSRAELYTPLLSHNCIQPVRPFEFSSQWEIYQFKKDVEEYRNCIMKFIEEQKEEIKRHQEAIRRHQEAAKAAIKEWKDFVKMWKLK